MAPKRVFAFLLVGCAAAASLVQPTQAPVAMVSTGKPTEALVAASPKPTVPLKVCSSDDDCGTDAVCVETVCAPVPDSSGDSDAGIDSPANKASEQAPDRVDIDGNALSDDDAATHSIRRHETGSTESTDDDASLAVARPDMGAHVAAADDGVHGRERRGSSVGALTARNVATSVAPSPSPTMNHNAKRPTPTPTTFRDGEPMPTAATALAGTPSAAPSAAATVAATASSPPPDVGHGRQRRDSSVERIDGPRVVVAPSPLTTGFMVESGEDSSVERIDGPRDMAASVGRRPRRQ